MSEKNEIKKNLTIVHTVWESFKKRFKSDSEHNFVDQKWTKIMLSYQNEANASMNRLIWRKKYFFSLFSYIFDICLEKYILNVGICSIFHVFTLYFFSSLFGSWRRCTAEWRMTGATSHAPLLWVVFACGPRHAHPQHLPHMRHGTASYGPFIIYYILKVVFASGPRHTFPLTFATCGAWNIPSKECNIQKVVFTCGPRQEHP